MLVTLGSILRLKDWRLSGGLRKPGRRRGDVHRSIARHGLEFRHANGQRDEYWIVSIGLFRAWRSSRGSLLQLPRHHGLLDWNPTHLRKDNKNMSANRSSYGRSHGSSDEDPNADPNADTDADTDADTNADTNVVADRQPNVIADGQPDHQPNFIANRQPNVVADGPPDPSADRQPNASADRQPYGPPNAPKGMRCLV